MSKLTFSEAKSRHITAARSSYDFQVNDQFLIKSGSNVTRKIVKAINHESGSVTGIDPDGGGSVTITLNPNSPAMDGGEFKYWIDEGKAMPRTKGQLGEDDDMDVLGDETEIIPDVDDFMDDDYEEPEMGDLDIGDDVDMGGDEFGESALGERDDYDGPGDDDDDDDMVGDDDDDPDHPTKRVKRAPSTDIPKDESFAHQLAAFLNEEGGTPDTDQIPSNTVGGGVDDSEHADEDGEDVEDTPAPADTIGMEDGGEVQTMAGDGSSNVGGSAPEDEVATHGDTGDSPTQGDTTMPTAGEHEPGEPDKAKGESKRPIPRSVREDVSMAINLVAKGAKAEALAPRLLRGATKG